MGGKYTRKDVIAFMLFYLYSLFIILCWLFILFHRNNNLISSVGSIFVRALAWSNLLNYQPDIGGHHAHLHSIVWWVNVPFALIYAGVVDYLVSKKMKLQKIISVLSITIFFISFAIYSITTFLFLFELERFAYVLFVPQM